MTQPSIVQSQTSSGSGTSTTVTMPTGVTDDNIILIHGSKDDNNAWSSVPTEWGTAVFDQALGTAARQTLWAYPASSEPASYSISHDSEVTAFGVIELQGGDKDDIIEAFAASDGSGTTATAPSSTPTNSNTLVFRFFASDRRTLSSLPATEEFNITAGGSGDTGNAATYEDGPAGGASTGTDTASLTSDQWGAATVCINEGGAASYNLSVGVGAFSLAVIAIDLLHGAQLEANVGAFVTSGQSITLNTGYTLNVDAASYTTTGQDIGFFRDHVLPVAVGAFNLSGMDAGLIKGSQLIGAPGSFSLSGVPVTFVSGYALAAETVSFTLTGIDAGLIADRYLDIGTGAFALSGIDAAILKSSQITATASAFNVTGIDVELDYSPVSGPEHYTLDATVGAFNTAGKIAGFLVGRVLNAVTGSFNLTGLAAALISHRNLNATVTRFNFTGIDVGFFSARHLTAEIGEFTTTGIDVGLSIVQPSNISPTSFLGAFDPVSALVATIDSVAQLKGTL